MSNQQKVFAAGLWAAIGLVLATVGLVYGKSDVVGIYVCTCILASSIFGASTKS